MCRFIKPDTFRVIEQRDTRRVTELPDMHRVTELIIRRVTVQRATLTDVRAFIVATATLSTWVSPPVRARLSAALLKVAEARESAL
jgi:hypothetical protein